MNDSDYERLFKTLKPRLWLPVLLLYGRKNLEKLESVKKLLDAAELEHKIRARDTERIGGDGSSGRIPLPFGGGISPDI